MWRASHSSSSPRQPGGGRTLVFLQRRAAALTHTTVDGQRDLALPENVRMDLLAGTQHGVASFPPSGTALNLGSARSGGVQLPKPTPQNNVMRALHRAWNEWVGKNTPPPPSEYPRLSDGTLVRIDEVKFPS
jgi:hypothetical protein